MKKKTYSLAIVCGTDGVHLNLTETTYSPDGRRQDVRNVVSEWFTGDGRLEEAEARARRLASACVVRNLEGQRGT